MYSVLSVQHVLIISSLRGLFRRLYGLQCALMLLIMPIANTLNYCQEHK